VSAAFIAIQQDRHRRVMVRGDIDGRRTSNLKEEHMNRNDMIRQLVDFSLAGAARDSRDSWLREVLEKGFKGFENLSTADLLRELQFRGLADFDEVEELGDGGGEDGEFEDHWEYRIENLIRTRTTPT
jgi:hypothetical protein